MIHSNFRYFPKNRNARRRMAVLVFSFCNFQSLKCLKDIVGNKLIMKTQSSERLWNEIEIDLKETKSANIFEQRVINIYLENYERFKCEKPNCISCE